jgi:hypothetical protein
MNSYCVRLDDNETPRTLWRVLSTEKNKVLILNEETGKQVTMKLSQVWVIY